MTDRAYKISNAFKRLIKDARDMQNHLQRLKGSYSTSILKRIDNAEKALALLQLMAKAWTTRFDQLKEGN